jgi:tRNA pseudouridine38-40 synthase
MNTAHRSTKGAYEKVRFMVAFLCIVIYGQERSILVSDAFSVNPRLASSGSLTRPQNTVSRATAPPVAPYNDGFAEDKDPATAGIPLRYDPTRVRYRCRVAYDGTSYYGFQLQGRRDGSPQQQTPQSSEGKGPPNSRTKTRRQTEEQRTVQGVLEEVLSRRFQRVVKVVGAGRTDAGVHARGQAFHFDLFRHNETLGALDTINGAGIRSKGISDLELSMNRMLPPDVRVWNLQPAPPPSFLNVPKSSVPSGDVDDPDDEGVDGTGSSDRDGMYNWNAIHACSSKLYSYRISIGDAMDPLERYNRWQLDWGHQIDPKRLERILQSYQGTHDFVCFSGALERNERKTGAVQNTVRTVHSIRLVKESSSSDGSACADYHYRVDIYLDGALYKMVRNLIGTALDVCRGKLSEETFLDLLHRPGELNYSRKNNPCKPAPPAGLTLERVFYPDDNAF